MATLCNTKSLWVTSAACTGGKSEVHYILSAKYIVDDVVTVRSTQCSVNKNAQALIARTTRRVLYAEGVPCTIFKVWQGHRREVSKPGTDITQSVIIQVTIVNDIQVVCRRIIKVSSIRESV